MLSNGVERQPVLLKTKLIDKMKSSSTAGEKSSQQGKRDAVREEQASTPTPGTV